MWPSPTLRSSPRERVRILRNSHRSALRNWRFVAINRQEMNVSQVGQDTNKSAQSGRDFYRTMRELSRMHCAKTSRGEGPRARFESVSHCRDRERRVTRSRRSISRFWESETRVAIYPNQYGRKILIWV